MVYEFKFPDVGEGVTEGQIVKWHVKEGQKVKEDQVLAEVETDKAIVELPSPRAGTILKLHAKQGDRIEVGQTIVTFGTKEEKVAPKPEQKKKAEPVKEPVKEKVQPKRATTPPIVGRVLATPSTRQHARDLGVDLSKVKGTGPAGRVTKEDVQSAKSGKPVQHEKQAVSKPEVPLNLDFEKYGKVKKIPFTGIRKRIAENMVRAFQTTVPVTHHDEVDVTELNQIRKKQKERAKKQGIKLTFLPFIIKAVLTALKKYPILNASLDEANQEIILKKYYNFGIAVQTERGLMVPVIKNVDKKSIFKIAKEIQELAEKTRTGKIAIEELKGSTFTITNVGSIGGWFFTPIINYPEVAILGIGRMKEKIVVKDGKATIRMIMPLSLTFDHRVVDGAIAAQCANEIIAHLEDPDVLLVDVV